MELLDKLKLFAAFLLVCAGVVAYQYLVEQSGLYAILALIALLIVALIVALGSAPGKSAWEFAKSARTELRKVVWPERKETIQTTLVVVVLVVLIGLFLWMVDSGLSALVKTAVSS